MRLTTGAVNHREDDGDDEHRHDDDDAPNDADGSVSSTTSRPSTSASVPLIIRTNEDNISLSILKLFGL